MKINIPAKQTALQLVGPDELKLNTDKEVLSPGPYQILARVEAVGLCFSDLKLLKQFDAHARKSEVLCGIEPQALAENPAYVPGTKPTVPGHEACCTIVAVGDHVKHHRIGQRVLVQTDYRWLKTAASNAAFGYNFEGALQQYVLMDERIIIEPDSGESFLIPVEDHLSASAAALVEPWACVESSYISKERAAIKTGGKLLVVADKGRAVKGVQEAFDRAGAPAGVTVICAEPSQAAAHANAQKADTCESLPNEHFDDIVYFGSDKTTIETLNDKLAGGGIMNIVLGGSSIGAPVSVGVGRVHYGLTRWIGTLGDNAADSYCTIPQTGEVRKDDKVLVVGAAGPMGQMHVLRVICSGIDGLTVVGTDYDDHRLEGLSHKAAPPAKERGVKLSLVNPQKQPVTEAFSYVAIMAPVAPLVAQAINDSADNALINIFAGIPAPVKQDIDLDTYIARRCFMFGTSGSRLEDMKIVLDKVTRGQLDVNTSVDAVSGMAGAADGIRAVENRTLAGKIIVYPALPNLPLTTLDDLAAAYPTIAEKCPNDLWTQAAEEELLKNCRLTNDD